MEVARALDLVADEAASCDQRFVAARSLGASGDASAVPRLRALLSSPEWKLRWGAALALGDLRATEATADLSRLLEDEDETVRQGAQDALQLIRGAGQSLSGDAIARGGEYPRRGRGAKPALGARRSAKSDGKQGLADRVEDKMRRLGAVPNLLLIASGWLLAFGVTMSATPATPPFFRWVLAWVYPL